MLVFCVSINTFTDVDNYHSLDGTYRPGLEEWIDDENNFSESFFTGNFMYYDAYVPSDDLASSNVYYDNYNRQ